MYATSKKSVFPLGGAIKARICSVTQRGNPCFNFNTYAVGTGPNKGKDQPASWVPGARPEAFPCLQPSGVPNGLHAERPRPSQTRLAETHTPSN